MFRTNSLKGGRLLFAASVAAVLALPSARAWADGQEAAQDDGQTAVEGEVELTHDGGLQDRDVIRNSMMNAAAHDLPPGSPGTLHGVVIEDGLRVKARGRRLAPDGTTDVWAHRNYAYTGTFNSPCGGEPGAGVHVWRLRGSRDAKLETIIPTPVGSRSNDVKVARMNSGTILVHSNESCAGGPGGFEIYNVRNPRNPQFKASVRIDEINPVSDAVFGGITDVGVHNLWLFTQGRKDYVAAVSEGGFDNFRIYEITDPTNPVLVGAWGAEEIFDPGVGETTDPADPDQFNRVLAAALWLVDGFGNSANRFLHDVTINEEGTLAYLSNWDAGLVLLDISDPSSPQLVSVALDVANGSLDGEVNSHAAWPSEDGKIVVETEEDFSAWEAFAPPGSLTFGDLPSNTIPGTALATSAGDAFEGSQTGNVGSIEGTLVSVESGGLAGQTFAAVELSGSQPRFGDLDPINGELVWIGRACNGDALLNQDAFDAGDIAVVRRGACNFSEKLANAAAIGAVAIAISNNNPNSTPWGGVRIWDYSDPANPVLASLFDTECSASDEPAGTCDPVGTYSVHNVIVETVGEDDDDKGDDEERQVKAYISWYWDGMLILDVTDPYNPVEIARFSNTDLEFEEQNGGHQDFWGVHKIPGRSKIYASDRNGGLYVFEEFDPGDDDDDKGDDDDVKVAAKEDDD